jgi:hypothetical protein
MKHKRWDMREKDRLLFWIYGRGGRGEQGVRRGKGKGKGDLSTEVGLF